MSSNLFSNGVIGGGWGSFLGGAGAGEGFEACTSRRSVHSPNPNGPTRRDSGGRLLYHRGTGGMMLVGAGWTYPIASRALVEEPLHDGGVSSTVALRRMEDEKR